MKYLLIVILFIPVLTFAQIKIDRSNKEWSTKVDSALSKIRDIDSVYYSRLISVCDNIQYINKKFSSCSGFRHPKGTIKISKIDLNNGDVDNICAAIIHESLHLKIRSSGLKMKKAEEEFLCYSYELDFIKKIPDVDQRLIDNARNQMLLLSSE